jgi:F0F1-type ATP synthase epsilon subunit
MEILPDKVRVLTSFGEWSSEVDVERARVELDRATDLFHEHDHEADVEKAQQAVARARAQLEAYERSR